MENKSLNKFSVEKISLIESCLLKCWSIESCISWTLENPAKGQCGVTTLLINDIFGGEILKTRIGIDWHFYNRIGSIRYDFTRNQFSFDPDYEDIVSDKKEILKEINELQFKQFKVTFLKEYIDRKI